MGRVKAECSFFLFVLIRPSIFAAAVLCEPFFLFFPFFLFLCLHLPCIVVFQFVSSGRFRFFWPQTLVDFIFLSLSWSLHWSVCFDSVIKSKIPFRYFTCPALLRLGWAGLVGGWWVVCVWGWWWWWWFYRAVDKRVRLCRTRCKVQLIKKGVTKPAPTMPVPPGTSSGKSRRRNPIYPTPTRGK